jgi:plasmid stabilization system protein ParE
MRVRWTTDAADDLERICDYIAADRPEAARRIAVDITLAIGGLSAFPNRGRPGRVDDTRGLVLALLGQRLAFLYPLRRDSRRAEVCD